MACSPVRTDAFVRQPLRPARVLLGQLICAIAALFAVTPAHGQGPRIDPTVSECIRLGPTASACNGQTPSEHWWTYAQRNVVGTPRVVSEHTQRILVDSDEVTHAWEGPDCVPPNIPDVLTKQFMRTVRVKSSVKTARKESLGVEIGLTASLANLKSNANVELNEEGNGEREDTFSNQTTVGVALCTRYRRTVHCFQTHVTVIADVSVVVLFSVVCNGAVSGNRRECAQSTVTSTGIGHWGRDEQNFVTPLRRCVRCAPH